jgi:hypothetical protein
MKLHNLYIAVYVLLTIFLVSCNDFEDTVINSPVVAPDCPALRFSSENKTSFEIEPSSDMYFTLTVKRNNYENAAEFPVSFTDTTNSFTIPDVISFAAGDSTAALKVSIKSTAQIGVKIPIVITFESKNINPYLVEYGTYYGSASIIKWNSLGSCQFYDSFSFYKIATVTLEQRDDLPTVYRITSPYEEGILTDAEWDNWIGGTTQNKIVFTVQGTNVVWDDFWYTDLIYKGNAGSEVKAYLPSALSKTGDEQSVVVKDSDGNIQYFELYPYFYVDGLGGWGLNVVYLGFPGFDLASKLGKEVYSE